MRSRLRPARWLSRGLVILGFIAIAGGAMAPAAAVTGAPGNNGTVKVDGGALDNGPANEPHVGCGFSVEWFGFDQDASSTVTFTMQPPTADPNIAGAPTSMEFGPFTIDHDGYTQSFDIYDLLKNFAPHPNQGFHVKLETNTTWSNGADSKYKVFWVTGCVPDVGSVTLDKVVSGPGPAGDPGYTFTVVSSDAGATVQSPVTIKVSDAPVPVATHVALGSTVTITETNSQDAASTSYVVDGGAAQPGAGVVVTLSSTAAVGVVATNTFVPPPPPEQFGSVTLDKVVSGPAPAGDPGYTFTVVSSDAGATVQSPVTIKASDAPAPVATHVALGSTVTITETNSQGAESTSYVVDGGAAQPGAGVVVTLSSTAAVGVVATNAFASVLGETTTPPEPPTTDASHAPAQEPLARTGSNHLPLMFGIGMVGAGLALSVVARRLRTTQ